MARFSATGESDITSLKRHLGSADERERSFALFPCGTPSNLDRMGERLEVSHRFGGFCSMMSWLRFCACGMTVMAFLVGCGPSGRSVETGTVSGAVNINGKPLTSGTVVFFGENDGDTAVGPISTDGTYTLKYGAGFSIPVGDYRVAINEGPPPGAPSPAPEEIMKNPPKPTSSSLVPAKYRDAKTSGLIAVVKQGSNSGIDFNLK